MHPCGSESAREQPVGSRGARLACGSPGEVGCGEGAIRTRGLTGAPGRPLARWGCRPQGSRRGLSPPVPPLPPIAPAFFLCYCLQPPSETRGHSRNRAGLRSRRTPQGTLRVFWQRGAPERRSAGGGRGAPAQPSPAPAGPSPPPRARPRGSPSRPALPREGGWLHAAFLTLPSREGSLAGLGISLGPRAARRGSLSHSGRDELGPRWEHPHSPNQTTPQNSPCCSAGPFLLFGTMK